MYINNFITLREKFPYSEFFWSVFSRIWTECGEIRSISLCSVRMWGSMDQKNSKYGHRYVVLVWMVQGKVLDFYERKNPCVVYQKASKIASLTITRFAVKNKFFSFSILADITLKTVRKSALFILKFIGRRHLLPVTPIDIDLAYSITSDWVLPWKVCIFFHMQFTKRNKRASTEKKSKL